MARELLVELVARQREHLLNVAQNGPEVILHLLGVGREQSCFAIINSIVVDEPVSLT